LIELACLVIVNILSVKTKIAMIVLKTTPHKCNVIFLMKCIVTIDSRYSLLIQNMTSKPKMYDYFCLGIL